MEHLTQEERLAYQQAVKKAILVIMGVSGCGKTTVAQGLQEALGWPYQEGDSLHPKANVDKMASGVPLTDEDRYPWLEKCHEWIQSIHAQHGAGILTCSALKRKYRDLLRGDMGNSVRFVYLNVPQAVLEDRMKKRVGHYMPPSLLPSQLATLEPPGQDENPIVVDVVQTPEETVRIVLDSLEKQL
nr:gluconokinase [Entomobacter blattae]